MKKCPECKSKIKELNQKCKGCGFKFVLMPEGKIRERYLRAPSLGALLFTQGWTFGARLYLPFLLSLIPIVGLVVLVVCIFFGRRWSWKYGSWENWQEFQDRMRLMDIIGVIWITILIITYLFFRET